METSASGSLSSGSSVKDKRNEEIRNVLEYWKQFDIEDRKVQLDKQVVDIRDTKGKSIAGRKHLNEVTKAFRAKPREEQVTTVQDILKSYQQEIDQLSRRAKSSEAAFLDLYKAIYDAPDPAPIIESLFSTQSVNTSQQLEINRLKNELKQYDEEFQQLKNQDITIRRLEDQLAEYRDKIEDKVEDEVARQVAEVEAACALTVSEVKEHHRAAEKRLAVALEATRTAQQAADRAQTRLFEVSTQAESRFTALQMENNIVSDNAERLQARVTELENELTQKNKNESARESAVASDDSSEERTEVMQGLLKELRSELINKEETIAIERSKSEQIANELKHKLSLKVEETSQLRKELAIRPHKDEVIGLKRQLRVLQKVIFNVDEDDDETVEERLAQMSSSDISALQKDGEHVFPELTTVSGSGKVEIQQEQQRKLELMLVARLKTIEGELIELRGKSESYRESESKALCELEKARAELKRHQELVGKLESDLENASSSKNKHGQSTSQGGMSAPDADLVALLSANNNKTSSNETSEVKSTRSEGGEGQMLAILTSQRDRYKERLDNIEGSHTALKEKLQRLEIEKKKLTNDNAALYEKIRYLQNYSQPPKSQRYNGQIDVETGVHRHQLQQSMDVSKLEYSNLYEQKMSPVAMFSQLERQKKLKELNTLERILLNTTVQIVSSKAGRTVMMIYFSAMHFLVFCTLYYVAHNSHGSCTGADHSYVHDQSGESQAHVLN